MGGCARVFFAVGDVGVGLVQGHLWYLCHQQTGLGPGEINVNSEERGQACGQSAVSLIPAHGPGGAVAASG